MIYGSLIKTLFHLKKNFMNNKCTMTCLLKKWAGES